MNIVTFSGAGLSKESGIPTFRDSKTGLWENHNIEDVASPEGWIKDKETVLRFYEQRFNNVQSSEPNIAHKALASLDQQYDVIHITQNVDNLLEKAGCKNVRHLHGSLFQRKCEKHSSASTLDGDINYQCDYLIDHVLPVKIGDLCPKCGSQLRPNVVWFGEFVDMFNLDDLPKSTDIFIVVGTSAQVHPAATLLWTFKECQELYFIDPTPAPRLKIYSRFENNATEAIPIIVNDLLNLPTYQRIAKHQERIIKNLQIDSPYVD